MSNLIITLISIALIGLVAVSTLFFGGDAFNKGSAKAAANTVVNQMSQIDAANTLHFLDTQTDAADVAALVTGEYLASVPAPGDISENDYEMDGSIVRLSGVALAVCEKVNEVAGAAAALDADTASTDDGLTEVGSAQFGCFVETAASATGEGDEVYSVLFK